MAKHPVGDANILISVPLEGDIDSFTLNVTQELPVTTCLSDAGPRRVAGNYDYSLDVSGGAGFAGGESDATLWGLIGHAGVAMAVDPTGENNDVDNPNYDATSIVLSSYSISGSVGGRIDFSATLQGNSELARNAA